VESKNLTAVLLGQSGAGKSALGNVFLGRPPNFTALDYRDGCFKSSSWSEEGPTTQRPCRDSGEFLGIQWNMVDTPGKRP